MQPLFSILLNCNMKFTRIFLFIAAVAILASCGGNKKASEQEELAGMPKMHTEGADSAAVRKLVNDFMGQIVAGEYDLALNMINDAFNIDSVTGKPMPLNDATREAYMQTFKEFNITDYSIREIIFDDYKDNEVRCEVILDGAIPTNWYFKPVKCVGEWFLCMRDSNRGDSPLTR